MILAEKIALLRKRSGWSQEELARQLNVSRQSVSKWESGASLPDLDRILKMSDLFCVSTDYLLRDEVEQISMPEGEGIPEPDGVQSVSLEEANAFMDLTRSKSTRLAAAVSLCVLSPVTLILLGGYAELTDAGMTENLAGGLGVAVLLALVAIAVGIFITTGMRLNQYQYLEEESFTLQYGVKGVVERRKQQDEAGYRASVVAGVILCILGVIPLLLAAGLDAGDFVCVLCVDVLLILVALAAFLFVRFGAIWSSYQKLLQEEEYTPERKQTNRKLSWFPGVYWLLATAIYLGISFCMNDWKTTWVLWPVAGVLFAAVYGILTAVVKNKNRG